MADSTTGQPDLSIAEGGSPDLYGGGVTSPEGQTPGVDSSTEFDLDARNGVGTQSSGKYGGGFLTGQHDATDWDLMKPVNRKNESGGRNLG